MEMTENEILSNYLQAKSKTKQVEILADMNCCKKDDIIEILRKNNITYPPTTGPKSKEEKAVCDRILNNSKPVYKKPIASLLKEESSQKSSKVMESIPSSVALLVTKRISEIEDMLVRLEEEKDLLNKELKELKQFIEN